jgi:hypothetical protein
VHGPAAVGVSEEVEAQEGATGGLVDGAGGEELKGGVGVGELADGLPGLPGGFVEALPGRVEGLGDGPLVQYLGAHLVLHGFTGAQARQVDGRGHVGDLGEEGARELDGQGVTVEVGE